MNDPKGHVQVTLVSHVVSEKPSVTVSAPLVGGACTLARAVTTDTAKDGGRGSRLPLPTTCKVTPTDSMCRTAEDLNATSKKLQRYEALLNEIMPMVTPEVQAMIDDVRQQVS